MGGLKVVQQLLWGLMGCVLWGAVSAQAATPFAHGMVSITLDDGWPSQYTHARPALDARGLPATYFLVTEGIRNEWSGFMTASQVQTLMNGRNEIGSHTQTHPDLTTLSASQAEAEVRDSQAWLKSRFGLTSVPAFASPYGQYNPGILASVASYYGSHRTVNGGHNFRDSNRMQLRAYDVHANVSVSTVRGWIDQAAADGTWLILVFHQFVSGTPTDSTEFKASDFAAILDHVQLRGIETVTVSEGVARMNATPGSGSGDVVVYEDGLGDGFTDWSWASHDVGHRTVVHTGVSSLAAELDGWNALFLHHTSGLDASQYTALELWVNGGTTGGQGVRVAFYDGSRPQGSVRLDALLGHPIVAGTWQRVVIPLSSVGLASGTVRDLYIQDDTGGDQATVYLDDLRLLRSSAPPPTTPPFDLYTDVLGSGFNDWSWATRNLDQRSIVHTGTSAISMEPDNWSSLFFHSSAGIDLSRYRSIELWVHGGTAGGQIARLLLHDGSNALGDIRLDTALGHPIQPGTWQRVSVPLSTLGATSGTLRDFYLQDQSGGDQGTLYVDDLRLVP